MSIEAAKSFIEKMMLDGDFAKKLSEFKDAEECMAAVQAAGFYFTADEIKMVGQEAGFTANNQELSDDDLEKVAGGNLSTSDVIVLAIVIGVLATQPKRR